VKRLSKSRPSQQAPTATAETFFCVVVLTSLRHRLAIRRNSTRLEISQCTLKLHRRKNRQRFNTPCLFHHQTIVLGISIQNFSFAMTRLISWPCTSKKTVHFTRSVGGFHLFNKLNVARFRKAFDYDAMQRIS